MKPLLSPLLLVFLFSVSLLSQENASPAGPGATAQLSQDQIRDLIRSAADKDIENDRKQRNYTYIQREDEHKLDAKGQVKSTESRTYEIMVFYEEPVRKLIARDNKPLSDSDSRKEAEKVQKIIEKRKNENEGDRKKRLALPDLEPKEPIEQGFDAASVDLLSSHRRRAVDCRIS